MKIAFQMEPLSAVNPKTNSSGHLLLEALRRKHKVYHYEPQHLALKNGELYALAAEVKAWGKLTEYREMKLGDMDIILVRQDPPFDIHYITATYFLEQLPKKTRVLNNPQWIRNTPEKLAPLLFPEYVPPTLITRDAKAIAEFYREHKDIVIKPLYGHHGNGIFHIKPKDDNASAIIEYTLATSREPWIAQPYIPAIRKGNLRVLFIAGEIAGAFMVVPQEGEFRLYRGSKNIAHTLSAYETKMCKKIGAMLKERDLFYVGIDIIGKYLIEINVTSTGSIDKYNAVYGAKLEREFWNGLEQHA